MINVAIIPARLGSKRIKNKNIKIFFDKPIIYWTLKKIKKSRIFDLIVVSSDSDKILELSKKYGADVTITRPKNLSSDKSKTFDVIKHAIKFLEKLNLKINNVSCIYPCTPFLKIKDLKKSFTILNKNPRKLVMSVVKYSHPIERSFKLSGTKRIIFNNKKFKNYRTQDFNSHYHDAGQFYSLKYNSKDIENSKRIGLELPSWRAIDIDNSDDWKKAEIIFKSFKNYFLIN
jgi:pseudaminic acid cytidylyltransferase